MALLAVALVALLGAVAGSAEEAKGDRVALVMGNSQYEDLEPIPGAGDDARKVAAALRGLDFTVIELFDGTRGEMSAAVQRFVQRLSPGAIALFYYEGHGVQFRGKNFLLPVSAELQDDFSVLTEGVLAGSVLSAMAASGAEVKLLLLDASRRNRFVEASDSLSPGLAEMTADAAGTIVVYAAAPGRIAIEGGAASGAFANTFAALLSEPVVEVGRLLDTLRARVRTATAGRQVPWMSGALPGELYLRAPASTVETPAVETPLAAAEPALAVPQEPSAPGGAETASQPAVAPDDAPPGNTPPGDAPPEDALQDASGATPGEAPGKAPETGSPTAADERPSEGPETAAIESGSAEAAKAEEAEPEAAEPEAAEPVEAEPEEAGPATARATGAGATLQTIEAALSRADKQRVQESLAQQGYYDGEIDGIFGPGTRHAIRAYQEASGAPQTGWLSVAQLHRLLRLAGLGADQQNLNSIETRLPDPAPHAVPHRRRSR